MDLEHNQFGRESGEPLGVTLRPAIIDRHVLALDVTGFAQSLTERGQRHLRVGRANTEVANHRHSRLLCAYIERPRDRCTPKQRDKLPPPHGLPPRAEERTLARRGSSHRNEIGWPMSGSGRCCRKSRKSNEAKNLANVDFRTIPPLRCSVAPIRRSVVAFLRSEVVPHVPAPETDPRKDFFDSIGQNAKFRRDRRTS